jgi:uncharacterized membrane protein
MSDSKSLVLSFATLVLRTVFRFLLAALFFAAALLHFADPRLFLPIMPPVIPFPIACIVLSGFAELVGAIGLLIPLPRVQRLTGWWLTALLLAVFPANIYMAVAHIQIHGFPAHPWMAWARLILQPVLIALVLWVTGAGLKAAKRGEP